MLRPFIAIVVLLGCTFQAAADPIPQQMMGAWAKDGKCTVPSERLVITSTTAAFGEEKPAEMFYAQNDGPGGRNALHWVEEGVVSNIEYVADRDLIRLNGMGWGYPPTAYYQRCP